MHIEYEEFDEINDIFMYMASAAPPMKNTMPINSYKGYVMSFIPLSPTTGETYLMIYSKGSLDPGIYEFDVYFISLTPKRNTIADAAIENL